MFYWEHDSALSALLAKRAMFEEGLLATWINHGLWLIDRRVYDSGERPQVPSARGLQGRSGVDPLEGFDFSSVIATLLAAASHVVGADAGVVCHQALKLYEGMFEQALECAQERNGEPQIARSAR